MQTVILRHADNEGSIVEFHKKITPKVGDKIRVPLDAKASPHGLAEASAAMRGMTFQVVSWKELSGGNFIIYVRPSDVQP